MFSLEICFVLKSGDGRTTCAKTMITTSRDCGSASWINRRSNGRSCFLTSFDRSHFSRHLCSFFCCYHTKPTNFPSPSTAKDKTGVINDPICQTHSLPLVNIVLAEICSVLLDFEKWGRTDRRKTMITTGRVDQ